MKKKLGSLLVNAAFSLCLLLVAAITGSAIQPLKNLGVPEICVALLSFVTSLTTMAAAVAFFVRYKFRKFKNEEAQEIAVVNRYAVEERDVPLQCEAYSKICKIFKSNGTDIDSVNGLLQYCSRMPLSLAKERKTLVAYSRGKQREVSVRCQELENSFELWLWKGGFRAPEWGERIGPFRVWRGLDYVCVQEYSDVDVYESVQASFKGIVIFFDRAMSFRSFARFCCTGINKIRRWYSPFAKINTAEVCAEIKNCSGRARYVKLFEIFFN